MELSDGIQEQREGIESKLARNGRTAGAYAEAYGELKELALWCAIETARLDPSFGLTPVDAFDRALGEGGR